MINKTKINKFLTGISLGVVVALMPSSIFHQLFLVLGLSDIANILSVCTSFMCFSIGVGVAYQFKLDFIAGISLAFVSMIAGQAIKFQEGSVMLQGTGDIINALVALALGLYLIKFFPKKMHFYRLILLPAFMILIVGSISLLTFGISNAISMNLGMILYYFTLLQPLLMCILIAICLGVIIVSPISSVAISLIVGLDGNSAAAASLGIASMAMYLAICSFKVNGLGSSLAIFLGSPKLLMANFIRKPQILIPGMLTSIFTGALAYYFNFQGTSMSAGFGSSGLVGMIANLDINGYTWQNIGLTFMGYVLIPFLISLLLYFIFKKIKLIKKNDFIINIE